MTDDRPVEDLPAAIGRLSRELEDLRTTLAAQMPRSPTGDLEPTFRRTAKEGTVLALGQALSRTTYAKLWAWVLEQGLSAGTTPPFGVGDGSTTFTVPNLAGRVLVGAGALTPDTYTVGQVFGAASRLLVTANMPSHDHNVGGTTGGSGSHSHGGSTNTAGAHGAHTALTETTPGGQFGGVAAQNLSGGAHSHTIATDTEAAHTHSVTITESLVGGTTAFDVRQAGYGINYLIWV